MACGVWTGVGALLGGFSPLLYPRGGGVVQPAILLGSLGGLLGGVAWCVHMIRRSARARRSALATVGAGGWLGLAVTTFYGAILEGGIAYLVRTDVASALAPAAVSLGAFAAPAGFVLGLVLGWLWAGVEALPAGPAKLAPPPLPPAPTSGASPPPLPPQLYQDLLTPHQRSAFDHTPELDLPAVRTDDAGADQREDRPEPDARTQEPEDAQREDMDAWGEKPPSG